MGASKAAERPGLRRAASAVRWARVLIVLAACCALVLARTAYADGRALNVLGGQEGVDFTYEGGVLTVLGETPLTISMADPGAPPTDDGIAVDPGEGKTAHVTIDGVRIERTGENPGAAFSVASGGLDLVIEGENSLTSTFGHAGLRNGENPLAISGQGSLFAEGGGAAGIGGDRKQNGSNITIAGGTVTAVGDEPGAGIGGGFMSSGSNITITGGVVTARGGKFGAGIGGSYGYDLTGNSADVTITGGEVTAIGGYGSAGIGGGYWGFCSNVVIEGGQVTAQGGERAAGIGGGEGGGGNDIVITGGTVTATGGEWAAGVGGGFNGDGSDMAISGGTVTATGGSEGAGIGGGVVGDGRNIAISGGTVMAYGGDFATAIGGGSGLDNNIRPCSGGRGSNIAITGGFVAAIPGQTPDPDYAQGTVIRPIAQAIGSGYGSLTYGDSSITGGFFADEARDWAGNTVYGLAPAPGYAAAENREEATKDAFPVRVLPVATLEVRADVQRVCDGSAVAASEVVSAARYGGADALDAVAFEYREAGRSDWKAGLPEDVGTYRVRATLPEGADADGALYAAASAETDLAIVPADGAGRTGDPADGSPAPAERRGGALAATGDPSGALALIALACAVSAAALLRTASRRR